MPSETVSCVIVPPLSVRRLPVGVVKCSRCSQLLQNFSFAEACLSDNRVSATEECIMAKENVLAVLSLSGGNDGLNTVIPYTNSLYYNYRPTLGIPQDKVIPLNDQLGLYPAMAPLKKFWD